MISKSLEVLEAEHRMCVEIHEYAKTPWADINDIKAMLTFKKRQLKRKIKEQKRAQS